MNNLPVIQGKIFSVFGNKFIWSEPYLYMENVKEVNVFTELGIWKKVFARLYILKKS